MSDVQLAILAKLQPLRGLKLSITHRAADMRGMHFGKLSTTSRGGTSGEYVLHIQCSWRIEKEDQIITGRSDLWEPVEHLTGEAWEAWDYEQGNLQDHKLRTMFTTRDERSGSPRNDSDLLVVETIDADSYGGVVMQLSGGYVLRIFPDGSRGEDWRLFGDASEEHFVISGGVIRIGAKASERSK